MAGRIELLFGTSLGHCHVVLHRGWKSPQIREL